MPAEQKSSGRWIARYRDEDGKLRSAGTWDTEEEALAAADRAREHVDSTTLRDYFYDEWIPEEHVQIRTRIGYESVFRNYIEDELGDEYISTITTRQIRQLIRPLIKAKKLHAASKVKAVMGSMYKALIDADRAEVNPAHGVRVPRASADPFRSLEADDFRKIVSHLDPVSALFAKFLVGSGLRFGEATEVRVKDFDGTEILVRRRASRVGYDHGGNSRTVVLEATKSGHKRVVPLSPLLAKEVSEHIAAHEMGPNDLIFPARLFLRSRIIRLTPDKTRYIDENGRVRYHGTPTSYVMGCRCEDCKAAMAVYRRDYRRRTGRVKHGEGNKSEHLMADDWSHLWKRAVKKSGIGWIPRTHDLRHAHATILVSSGVDLFEVKERLGHQSIETTQIYLHRTKQQQSKAARAADVFFSDEE